MIIEVMKSEYWSKADMFLLPLTGLKDNEKFKMKSYLFWNEHSIEDYKLIVLFSYEDKEEFAEYCKNTVFPAMDKSITVLETYDFNNKTVMILDISEWAMDVEMLLVGKYSRFSKEMKRIVEKYHTYKDKQGFPKVPLLVYASLHPNEKLKILNDKTPIQWSAEEYDIDLHDLQEIGEVAGIYDKIQETLYKNIDEPCQVDTESDKEQ